MLSRKRVCNGMLLIILVLSMAGVGSAFGKVIYVDCDATGANDGTSWPDAYTDLQDALDEPPASGDEIRVAEGTYPPSKEDSPGVPLSKTFKLIDGVDIIGGYAGCGEPDPNERDVAVYETVLDGGGEGIRVVYAYMLNNAPVLDGFIMTSGAYGVWCTATDLAITNCIVRENSDDGIYSVSGSDPVIESCVIENNSGRGIWFNGISNSTIENCVIRNNAEEGLYCYGRGMTIRNNWIHHNGHAGSYDGIYFYSPNDSDCVENNTIAYNSGFGIYNEESVFYTPTISNCILWGNGAGGINDNCEATYSCITDPIFLDVSVVYDPNHYDLHLSPVSPCIDVGDPNGYCRSEFDIDGEARVIDIPDIGDGDVDVDMGADEFSYDLTRDGITDYRDFAVFAMAWRSDSGCGNWNPQCDLDWNGLVDMGDLAILADRWGIGWTQANE